MGTFSADVKSLNMWLEGFCHPFICQYNWWITAIYSDQTGEFLMNSSVSKSRKIHFRYLYGITGLLFVYGFYTLHVFTNIVLNHLETFLSENISLQCYGMTTTLSKKINNTHLQRYTQRSMIPQLYFSSWFPANYTWTLWLRCHCYKLSVLWSHSFC